MIKILQPKQNLRYNVLRNNVRIFSSDSLCECLDVLFDDSKRTNKEFNYVLEDTKGDLNVK